MSTKQEKDSCCSVSGHGGRCTLEAIMNVDERGQMVLPKELRTRAGIKAGDKLAAISWERQGVVCCIMLYPVDQFAEPVKNLVSPMLDDLREP